MIVKFLMNGERIVCFVPFWRAEVQILINKVIDEREETGRKEAEAGSKGQKRTVRLWRTAKLQHQSACMNFDLCISSNFDGAD